MAESYAVKLKSELAELEAWIGLREKELEDLTTAAAGDATSLKEAMTTMYAHDAFTTAYEGENPFSKAPKAGGGCVVM